MNNIPTALEFSDSYSFTSEYRNGEKYTNYSNIMKFAIDFAKFYVENALASAAHNAIAKEEPDYLGGEWLMIDRDSILNAYNLENIK
jgi:hypothetical protein